MQNYYQCPSCASERIKRSPRGFIRRMFNLFVPVESLDCEDCQRHFKRLPQQVLTAPRLAAWGSVIVISAGYVFYSTNQSATTGAGRAPPTETPLMSEVDEMHAAEMTALEDRIALLKQRLTHTEVQLSMHRDRAESANQKLEDYAQEIEEAERLQEALLQTEQNLLVTLSQNQELETELTETQTQVSKLTNELDYERSLNPRIREELSKVQTDRTNLESSLENAHESNEKTELELTRLNQSLIDIQVELDRQNVENTSIAQELVTLKDSNQALQQDLKQAAIDNEQTQAQLNTQISELRAKLRQADEVLRDVTVAKEANTALEQDLNRVVAEKEASEVQLNALLSRLNRKLDQAEDDLDKKSAEYEQSMTDMRRQLAQSIGDKKALDKEVSRLGNEVERLTADLKEQNNRMGGEIERLIAGLKQGEADLNDAKEEIALLRAEVAEEPASPAIKDVNYALENWRRAWSSQQMEPYLSAYSPHFEPSNGISREEWRERRTQRLNEPEFVSVTLDSVQFQALTEDRLRASFVQRYESESYSDVANKTLVFALEDDAWKIISERTASRISTEAIKFN